METAGEIVKFLLTKYLLSKIETGSDNFCY
jgi:hypothetical protein